MKNKDISRLVELYLKDIITYEELLQYMEKLEGDDLPEPPTIY